MRSDKFYLVRTDNSYTVDGNAGRTPEIFRPKTSLTDAVQAAVTLASGGKPHGVYEVKLVGVAAPPVAKFTKAKRS